MYRGIISPDEEEKWDIRLKFDSIRDWKTDNSLINASRHVHTVIVDHYTGHIWVGTGDSDMHCRILYSDDNGETFRIVGMGSPEWTTLSIWFTKRYVYWNMDTSRPESIWRIPRSIYEENGFWPCITPELSSGWTKVGRRYYITKNETPGHFTKNNGKIYIEKKARPLNSNNKVRVIDDLTYDYREQVIKLCTGAHWYHCWAKDNSEDDILIMGTSPEGRNPVTDEYPYAYRDWRGRVFGIKEQHDGKCDIQELISIPPKDPDAGALVNRYTQLEPKFQDQDGYIYFATKNTEWHEIYKTRLKWIDSKDLYPKISQPHFF